ncbi:DUF2064 domain-containing protein [Nitrosomonas sp. Nm132]|uniref:TIGR04282 family arsenosugar biosynthesis glycosyltransferase n=1 Tax=Nitrosomonas sp. Nm132 TaxID=1881053 RepID=UPI00088D0C8E|nr:DUF2064 domain-containing protein [Nitrosomonas sp. Nm132]SDH15344.1 hypothetical protein SAMN05428952_100683 [Nitrosomonas sp. Nm132]
MDEITLVLVCKRPALGIGKQRLVARLGMEKTRQIAQALLNCALEDVKNWQGPVVIAPALEADHDWAATLLLSSKSVRIRPQATGNLGQRLNGIDSKLRSEGLKQLVYIGSDAPLLTETDYAACRAALQHHDTVLIPATDGGVALMASCHPWPLLVSLPWSTDQLGAALIDCCRSAGQSVALLAQRSDVDKLEDCLELVALLQNEERPARRQLHALVSNIINKMENHDD